MIPCSSHSCNQHSRCCRHSLREASVEVPASLRAPAPFKRLSFRMQRISIINSLGRALDFSNVFFRVENWKIGKEREKILSPFPPPFLEFSTASAQNSASISICQIQYKYIFMYICIFSLRSVPLDSHWNQSQKCPGFGYGGAIR